MEKMNYKEFQKRVLNDFRKKYPDVKVEIHEIKKPQNSYTGLTFSKDMNGISGGPALDLDMVFEAYRKTGNYESVLKEMMDSYEEAVRNAAKYLGAGGAISRLTDYGYVREHLLLQVINKDWNEERLADLAHFDTLDLSLVCRIEVGEMGTVLVQDKMLEQLGVSAEKLFRDAFERQEMDNPYTICPLGQFLFHAEEEDPALYLARTEKEIFGAAALFYPGFFEKAAEQLKGSYYILPSSIHEVLLLKESAVEDPQSLEEMVRTINRDQVSPEDRLADHAYHYDSDKGTFETLRDYIDRKQEECLESTMEDNADAAISRLLGGQGEEGMGTMLNAESGKPDRFNTEAVFAG